MKQSKSRDPRIAELENALIRLSIQYDKAQHDYLKAIKDCDQYRLALSCTTHEGAKHAAEALMQMQKRIEYLETQHTLDMMEKAGAP